MTAVKAVRVNGPTGAEAAGTTEPPEQKNRIMNTLAELSLVAVTLFATTAAQAELVRGHVRGNGTYVAPYYRTPANQAAAAKGLLEEASAIRNC